MDRPPSPAQPSLLLPAVPFLAGSIAGGVGIAVGHPLDTIKTLQQVQNVANQSPGSKSLHLLKVAKHIYTENGVPGFFRGLLYPLAMAGVVNAAFFGATELCRRLLQAYESSPNGGGSLYAHAYVAGMAGGLAQLPLVVPAEVVKVQLQAQLQRGHLPRGIGGSLRHSALVIRQQGLTGLYRGMAITSIRDVPTYGVYMVTFEYVKNRLDSALGSKDGIVAELVAGGCAGVTSWTLATPADVIKSRVQAAAANGETADTRMWPAAVGIYRDAGVGGFVRGWPAIVTRAFVTNAVTFLVYMNLLRWLTRSSASSAQEAAG